MSKAAELAALIGSGQAQGDKNLIINGAMTVDQRHDGSSFTIVNGNSTTGVIADRFRVNETSGVVMTGQRVADAPVGFEYSSKLTVTTADSSLGSTEFHRMIQPIEGKNISNLNWGTSNAKTLTLTFYVKSSLTGQYYISVFNNAADRTLLKGYTISSANTWEKKTITIIGDQSGTWLTTNAVGIYLMWSLGTGSSYQSSTLNAYQAGFFMAKSDQVNLAATNGSTWQLTGVQLEVGDGPGTAFEHEDIGTTLAKCQRYYNRMNADAAYSMLGVGFTQTTRYAKAQVFFPVEMRSAPTLGQSANNTLTVFSAAASPAFNADAAINNPATHSTNLTLDVSSGLTAGQGMTIMANNSTAAFFEYIAEL
tara:strand:+ start:776 stop:1873 length:1098 start_codon:yes stop_codon:yes gene_type:complete